jgi:hypothetical protein
MYFESQTAMQSPLIKAIIRQKNAEHEFAIPKPAVMGGDSNQARK